MENKTAYEYIPTFYAGRCIFITGGTGFMGKVLIEKILRSCPDVANIFVLIRPKKELSINDRLKKMLDNKLDGRGVSINYYTSYCTSYYCYNTIN
ncbi:PREDICTED: putative fatty acyl-CoA reductase CG5065 [Vollenhovia emeryi]|uniref:putative fatty acyl-CoA reductase CG5065 n=1 Tax=Vollenhovia emeryi TaxID=411798 RepID=UPI0005F53F86|nr:PREDICTED: putative fatty acyl-CoA reductase CG5065 [Vollenhovia emeryi]